MSASPSTAVPRLFYHPAYWCHSCDMSIGLPPSPTPNALLCPHCHRDSLEQMDMDDDASPSAPPPRSPLDHPSASVAAGFTASDDNFLLNSPYLHRLIHHLTTAADAGNPRSDPAPRSSIESLEELAITADSDPTMLCPVCKDPFVVDSVAKLMPCKHSYHSDCIVPWLEINNSCPVCRYKLPAAEERAAEEEGAGYVGEVRLEDWMGDEGDLYGFRDTLRRIARRHGWTDEGNIGGGSEGNLFSPTQIGEVERGGGVLERENSVETVSSWPRWQGEERGGGGGGTDETDAFARR